jgi:hypothetical protein
LSKIDRFSEFFFAKYQDVTVYHKYAENTFQHPFIVYSGAGDSISEIEETDKGIIWDRAHIALAEKHS